MLIPKKNRVAVYNALFRDGVLVAKKDFNLPKHHDIDVPNIHVMKLLQSLKSKGFVKEDFNWGWFYWFLTNEGIEFLRVYLHLPEDIVPATLKKPKVEPRTPTQTRSAPSGRKPFGQEGEKKVGAPSGDFKPDFRGGFGRGGRGGQQGSRDTYRRDQGAGQRGGFGRGQ